MQELFETLDRPWLGPARAGNLKEAVRQYVACYDYVSFPELQRKLEPYVPTRGDWLIGGSVPHVILWVGLSSELCTAIEELIAEKALFYHPASPLVFLIDGGMLTLPIAKRCPRSGYKTDHWLPVCLRLTPLDSSHVRERHCRA
jgi:hypothetical protein